MNNFNNKNRLKKIISVLFISGSLVFIAQSIFAETGTTLNTYDTTASIISEVSVDDVAEYSAQIKWKTNELADSFVYYGTTYGAYTLYSQSRCDGVGNVLQHCVNLVNLYPNTKYYYRVQSRNLVGLSTHSVGYFVTLPRNGVYMTSTSTDADTSTSSSSISTATLGNATTSTTNTTTTTSTSGSTTTTTDTSEITTTSATTSTTATAASGTTTDTQTTTSSQTTAIATSTAAATATDTGTQETTGSKTTAVATTTTTSVPPTSVTTQTYYPTAPVIKPAPVRPVPTPVMPTRLPTAITPSVFPKTERIESKIILKGGGNVVNSEDVYVKTGQMVKSVEVRLLREDNPTSLYLGQAKFDSENARWVFHWDSTQTPDDKYTILSVITTSNNEVVQGDKRTVIIKNKKGVQQSGTATSIRTRATSSAAIQDEDASLVAPLSFVDTEKFVEQIKKENQKIEERAKKDIANILLIPEAAKKNANSVAFEQEAAKQLEELRSAIDQGNDAKKKEIVVDMVSAAAILSKDIPQDVLAKRVEESVAKLEQVVALQKNGVVDTKNFEVTAVETAEVEARPDGTSTASKISFKGKALPNSFATLYIFSIPVVVTVKTDSDGYWNYTLDKELEDGKHQVFVAITDIKGAVVVKSEPVPFIKEASAITIDRIAIAPVQQEAPSFAGDNYFYGSIAAIVFIIIIILMLLGINRRNTLQ